MLENEFRRVLLAKILSCVFNYVNPSLKVIFDWL